MAKITVAFDPETKDGSKEQETLYMAFAGAGPGALFTTFEFSQPIAGFQGGTTIIEPKGNDGDSDPVASIEFFTDADCFAHNVTVVDDTVAQVREWARRLVERTARINRMPRMDD